MKIQDALNDNLIENITSDFFISKGFRCYPNINKDYIRYSRLWERRIVTDFVCDTNDRLYLNVSEIAWEDNQPSFEVEIVADKNKK